MKTNETINFTNTLAARLVAQVGGLRTDPATPDRRPRQPMGDQHGREG
jgi:hypothetical protein